jgi:hypothetical protein
MIRSSSATPIGTRISRRHIGGSTQAHYSFAGLFLPQIRLNLGEKTLMARHNGSSFFQPKAIQGEKDGIIQERVGSDVVAF